MVETSGAWAGGWGRSSAALGGTVPPVLSGGKARMRGAVHHSTRNPAVAAPQPWQLEVTGLLDEQHVSAWSDSPRQRARFVTDLCSSLTKFDDTYVCVLDGS